MERYYYIPESWVVNAPDFEEAKDLVTNLLRTQKKEFNQNGLVFIINYLHFEGLCFRHGEPELILGGK